MLDFSKELLQEEKNGNQENLILVQVHYGNMLKL